MSLVYNEFLNSITATNIYYCDLKKFVDKDDYFQKLKKNILAEFNDHYKNQLKSPNEIIYYDCVKDVNCIIINGDTGIIINNLLLIDNQLYFVIKYIYNEQENYSRITVYPQNYNKTMNIKNMGYVGNLLHQYSAAIQILRNYEKYKDMYNVVFRTIYVYKRRL